MKKIIMAFSLLLAFTYGKSQDQPQRPSMQEHLKKTQEILQKELQLNLTQKQKVEAAFQEFMIAAQKLHEQNPPPPPPPPDPKVKAAFDKLVAERDARIKEVLTEDQYKKYLEVEKTLRPPHPGGPPPPPPADK